MAAANTDKLRKTVKRFSTTIASPGVASNSATTIPLEDTTGVPTDTAVDLVINRVNSNGALQNTWETATVVISGSNGTNAVRGVEGTASAWATGTVVEILWTADQWNDAVDAILTEHDQDGGHNDITSDSITNAGTLTQTGVASFSDHIDVADGKAYRDSNNNEVFTHTTTASAVNNISFIPSATGDAVETTVVGGDTDVDHKVSGKGAGSTYIQSNIWFNVNKDGTNQSNVANNDLITWAAKSDPNGDFNLSTDQWTCPMSGRYQVTAQVTYSGTLDNQRYGLTLQRDTGGGMADYRQNILPAGSNAGHGVCINAIVDIDKDDVFQLLVASSDSGNTADIGGSGVETFWSMHLLSVD